MKKPTAVVGLGSRREGWLSIKLDSVKFIFEIERGKRSLQTFSLTELKARFFSIAGLAAELLERAMRSNTGCNAETVGAAIPAVSLVCCTNMTKEIYI
jgi:hypothetical protein